MQTLFYLGYGRGVRLLFGGHYSLVFVVSFLSNCRLATCHSEVKNRWYRVFLDYKLMKLERGSQQTPYYKILFEAAFGKVFYTNAQMLRGHEAFSFHFYKPFSLKFGSWGNLKVLTFDFEWFSSEVHCELEIKTVSNFPHFLSSPTMMLQVLFPTIIRQFSQPLYDYGG